MNLKEINFNTMENYMKDPDKYEGFQINTYKCIHNHFLGSILAILGLFIPVPISNYASIFKDSKYGWVFTISNVPLGWVMIAVAIIF